MNLAINILALIGAFSSIGLVIWLVNFIGQWRMDFNWLKELSESRAKSGNEFALTTQNAIWDIKKRLETLESNQPSPERTN